METTFPAPPVPAPQAASVRIANQPSGIRQPNEADLQQLPPARTSLDAELVDQGLAAWDAQNSLGMASSLSVRGFSVLSQGVSSLQVGRNYINGHPDLVWRFHRDPATVSGASFVGGADATLLGSGNPAGALLYSTRQPQESPVNQLGATIGTSGLKRLTADLQASAGSIQTRLNAAIQRGDRSVENVKDGREVFLLSSKLPWRTGKLTLDLEYDRYRMPFAFGTVYAGGHFWYDTPYVDPRSSADRRYFRQALELTQQLGSDMRLSASLQNARSTRDEVLLGSYAVTGPRTASGYYRTIEEANRQQDASVRLDGRFQTGPIQHDWTTAAQWLTLRRNFEGPQNVAGFKLDLQNPQFPANLAALKLSPRFAFERYREHGLAIADTLSSPALPGWKLYLAGRHSGFAMDSSTSPLRPLRRVAQARYNTYSAGIGKQLSPAHRVWLSRTEGFLPNRGQFADGSYLPPSTSRQWELGWAWQPPAATDAGSGAPEARLLPKVSLALFDLRQSNLSAPDPRQPDASILVGSNHSRGLQAQLQGYWQGLDWQGGLTAMHARVAEPNRPGQGHFLPGMADYYGALKVGKTWTATGMGELRGWLQWVGSASRPGDDRASFRAPGYGIVNAGFQHAPAGSAVRWGMTVQNLADRRYVRALSGADTVWQGPRRNLQLWMNMKL